MPFADVGNGPIIVPGLFGAGYADDDDERRGKGLTTVPEGNPTLAGRSVLIVEDEFVISMDLEHMLSDAGCEVVGVAADSAEAIRLAEANRPDFITMDINLRGGRDGIDTAIEIYERFGIRSIFISAYSDSETVRRAGAARPLSWLPKPVSRAKLEAAMKALPEED